MNKKDAIKKVSKGMQKNTVAMSIDMNRLSLKKLKNYNPLKSDSLTV